jgi:hypothetical protein
MRRARNTYIVSDMLPQPAQTSPLQACELLKHEWLRIPESLALLAELRCILSSMPAELLPNTVKNYRMQIQARVREAVSRAAQVTKQRKTKA